MTLFRYFARRFTMTFLWVLGGFALFMALLDLINVSRRFERVDLSFGELVRLMALRLPEGLYQILPLIVILATIVLFLALARSNELVVTRAAGRSALRTLVAPVSAAFVIGLLGLAVVNPIIAATKKQYEAVEDDLLRGTRSTMSLGPDGLWLRQGSPEGQMVIRAGQSNIDGTVLDRVSFFGFSPEGVPMTRIEARRAELGDGAWTLSEAKSWRLDELGAAEKLAQTHETLQVPSTLTRDQIRDGFGAPSSIPVWDLPAFISRLEEAGFSSRRHRIWLHSEMATPLMIVAMVLAGAAFTMRHGRLGGTGVMVIGALLLGFGFFFIRNLAQILGENGQVPVLLAAWAPPVAMILAALGLILHLEDG